MISDLKSLWVDIVFVWKIISNAFLCLLLELCSQFDVFKNFYPSDTILVAI
nr:MAG TPA: hypothetical protein [Caudoviricetes sp.]